MQQAMHKMHTRECCSIALIIFCCLRYCCWFVWLWWKIKKKNWSGDEHTVANLIRDDPSLERARLRSFGCFYQQNALVDGKFQSNCGWCAMVFSIDSLVVVGMFRWDVKRTDVSWMSNVFVVRPMVWNIHIFDILGVAFRRLVEGLASATQTKIISRSFLRQAVECYCLSPAWGRWHCLIASNIEIAMQLSSFIANFAVQLRFRLIDCGWPVGHRNRYDLFCRCKAQYFWICTKMSNPRVWKLPEF